MKRINVLFSLLALLLLQSAVFAQDDDDKDHKKKKYEFVKTKAVNNHYNVSSSDKLNIKNSFGSVEVKTWNRNEIKVDVAIEVSANTEALAQKILDKISVKDSQSGGEISFETKIDNINNSNGEKSTMEINYTISMPASNPLKISNEFGATRVPDYRGEVNLTSKFGSLTAGHLANVKKLQVEFGKAKVESVAGGDVTVKYSKSEFGKMSGNIKLNVEFSSATKINVDNSLTGLDVKTSYSTLNIKPSTDLSASFAISTSYGNLKNNTGIKFDSDEEDDRRGPKFDHKYNGKSGNGSVPVKITSNFGKIILGEASAEDMKDKEKSKHKTKTT